MDGHFSGRRGRDIAHAASVKRQSNTAHVRFDLQGSKHESEGGGHSCLGRPGAERGGSGCRCSDLVETALGDSRSHLHFHVFRPRCSHHQEHHEGHFRCVDGEGSAPHRHGRAWSRHRVRPWCEECSRSPRVVLDIGSSVDVHALGRRRRGGSGSGVGRGPAGLSEQVGSHAHDHSDRSRPWCGIDVVSSLARAMERPFRCLVLFPRISFVVSCVCLWLMDPCLSSWFMEPSTSVFHPVRSIPFETGTIGRGFRFHPSVSSDS